MRIDSITPLQQWVSRLRAECGLVWVVSLVVCGCVSRPTSHYPPLSPAENRTDSRLRASLSRQAKGHDGYSGVYVLDSNLEALLARAQLIEAAQQTIDIQSYIMRGDATGRLLAERILDAADRGVRVRLLVDDVSVLWKDSSITRLDGHPNIELRVFNPFTGTRTSRLLIFYDFLHAGRLTRRMHNKLFSVDNSAAIVGGRNIGDEYFVEREGITFMDLDVLVTGPAVQELSASFEEYWNSEWAYPLAAFKTERKEVRNYEKIRRFIQTHSPQDEQSVFAAAIRQSELLPRLLAGKLALDWAPAQVVYDRPAKINGEETDLPAIRVSPQVWALAQTVREELIVLSPYFVPGPDGVALLGHLRQRGVRVRILTNSLKSTDVLMAHTGYARYRQALLEAGVELYELKPSAVDRRKDPRLQVRRGSRASLHAKSFIFDRQTVFVGSMNLDHRAHYLNTELGLVIQSPEVAGKIAALFEESTQPKNSYRLELKENRVLASPKQGGESRLQWPRWITEEKGRDVRFTREPHAGLCLELWNSFLMLLPLEGQL